VAHARNTLVVSGNTGVYCSCGGERPGPAVRREGIVLAPHTPPSSRPAPSPLAPGDAVADADASADGHRRWPRVLAAAALVAALGACGYLLGCRGGTEYRVIFPNAGQLVVGDVVRVGGIPAGSVKGVELTDDNRAEVRISLDDRYAPLHEGTTATIRHQGLIGVANRYVDVSPGPNFADEIRAGGTIDADKTTSIIEVDQFFNTLDARTRGGLKDVIRGFADWYAGQEANANDSARYFPPALYQMAGFERELTRDSAAFEQFLTQTGETMGALAQRRTELTALVTNLRTTLGALSSNTGSLATALDAVPPALREGADSFVALRRAIPSLRRFFSAAEPGSEGLAAFLARLAPVTEAAVPRFEQFTDLFTQPGASNDLLDALRDLPGLARLTKGALPRGVRALEKSTPIFSFARPYFPDFTQWARSFGAIFAPYDANGHYARTLAMFDAFSFVDDGAGGHFDPKPPAARGTSPYLVSGNVRRCPGAATRPPADGSAPFVDSGELSNPDCDPSQVPGR
jgi:phospholipid/cholesterol/gamma-HCH transport system substrate-binding protein